MEIITAITVNAKSETPMRTGLTVIRSKLELMVITNYYRLCSYRGDYSQVLAVVEEQFEKGTVRESCLIHKC